MGTVLDGQLKIWRELATSRTVVAGYDHKIGCPGLVVTVAPQVESIWMRCLTS